MKKHILNIIFIILLIICGFIAYKNALVVIHHGFPLYSKEIIRLLVATFILGFSLSTIIYNIVYTNAQNNMNIYKRELEKISINNDESSSKISVLESKIQVLEKALEKALNK